MSAKKFYRVLLLGLDAGGKTTMLYKLKLGEVVTTIPTMGFNVETVLHKDAKFTMWDVGGKDKVRVLWHHYLPNTQALIYVVDSCDAERIDMARDELFNVLKYPEVANMAVVVCANKQDLPSSLPVQDIQQRLNIGSIKQKASIFGTCATTGDGLYEALEWILANAPTGPPEPEPEPEPKPTTTAAGGGYSVDVSQKELEIASAQLEGIRKVTEALGAEGSELTESIRKILNAKPEDTFEVSADGHLTIHTP